MTNNFSIKIPEELKLLQVPVSIPISGLIRREDYKYEFIGIGGNWPAIISPTGGEFNASGRSHQLPATVTFLPTTGIAINSLPYDATSCRNNNNILFTNIIAKTTFLNDNTVTYSNTNLVSCSGCLPRISLSIRGTGVLDETQQYSLISGNNIFDFVSSFGGLDRNIKYNYEIKSVGSNWPTIMITPTGGSFISSSSTYEMKHKLMFCPYSGSVCGTNNVLDFDITKCFDKTSLYCNLELSISPEYCSHEKVHSNTILINCKDCLPQITSYLPNKLILKSSNLVDITGVASGLIKNTTYNYAFSSHNNNWPSILEPISGSFVALSGTENIVSKLMFCYPSGLCNNSNPNVLPFSIDSVAQKNFNQNKLKNTLTLNITSHCGDFAISKPLVIECDDCLPCLTHANVRISGSPIITLDNECCVGQKLFRVDISNAIPGEEYFYEFIPTNAPGINQIAFVPTSGSMYFGSGGIGSIYAFCNVDLEEYSQTIINFELNHYNTNNKVLSSVVLKCNTGIC